MLRIALCAFIFAAGLVLGGLGPVLAILLILWIMLDDRRE